MLTFVKPENLQQLRDQYKNLCFKYHPDVSGFDSTEIMKEINVEYLRLSEILAKGTKFYESEMNFSTLYQEKIEILIKLKGLTLEIIGNWLWVTGDTKTHKDILKSLKFNYAPKKQAWFFKNYPYHKKQGEKPLDEIRYMYGSRIVSNQSEPSESLNLQIS